MRWREVLLPATSLYLLSYLSTSGGFSLRTKQIAVQAKLTADPNIDRDRIEFHHRQPVWRGGDNSPGNAVALTPVEHALAHFDLAQSAPDKRTKRGELWAYHIIVNRLTPNERQQLNQAVVTRTLAQNRRR